MEALFPVDINRLLLDTAIIFIAGLVFALLAHHVRLSPLLGYLVAGLVIGPFGLGLVRNEANIRFLAEVGVVLLMFALGVQLSLRQLLEMRGAVLVAGLGHTLLAILFGFAVTVLFGFPPAVALVMGYAVALCSSVVLVRLLSEEDAFHTAYGRTALGISLLQDLLAVVLISTLPFLGEAGSYASLAFNLVKAVVFLLVIILFARWLVPRILIWASSTGSREIFLFTVLAISLGSAILSALAGLSLALGAFLAGLIVSESIFSQAVLSEIIPLRDLFGLLFFISLGMLLSPAVLLEVWPLVVLLLVVAIAGKSLLIYGLLRVVGQHPYAALITGVSLAQIGEFSFIIASEAQRIGVLPTQLNAVVLAIAIISMALNPVLQPASRWMYRRLARAGVSGYPEEELAPTMQEPVPSVLLCGYGRVGHTIGQALDTFRVPFMVIDIDRRTVQSLQKRGIHAIYGDAANPRLLQRAGAGHFALGVIAVPRSDDVRTIALHLRQLCPTMRLLLRSHSEQETQLYFEWGVSDVVHVEMEASLAFVRHVLTTADVDTEIVDAYLQDIREGYYEGMRPREDE
ncbi:MAG: cation:proton antiporter [Armatimonadota bacterium]